MIKYLKCTYKIVREKLYNYPVLKKEIEEQLKDLGYTQAVFAKISTTQGHYSDPTARAVLSKEKILQSKNYKWVETIDTVIEILKKEHRGKYNLLILKYFQNVRTNEAINELKIDIDTFRKWDNDIIDLVLLIAAQKHLINVVE